MACKVDGTSVYLTRGDSLLLQIGITVNQQEYTPAAGDTIVFALKRDKMNSNRSAYIDAEPLIEKSSPYDTCLLTLDPSDTAELPFGNYVYDVQITFENGRVDTFINNAKFYLVPEVE